MNETPPPAVLSSSRLPQTCSVLVKGLLGPLRRADRGTLVVPEVALDLCPEKNKALRHGVLRES